MASPPIECQWKQEGSNNVEQGRAIKRFVAREPPHPRKLVLTGLRKQEDTGSTVRPDDAASASLDKLALSVLPMAHS